VLAPAPEKKATTLVDGSAKPRNAHGMRISSVRPFAFHPARLE